MPARAGFRFPGIVVMSMTLCLACSDSHSPTAPMSPAPPAGDISGVWAGTYKTNDNIDCDTTQSLAAQATFQQNGSRVSGTLTANGPCGLGYTFSGTLQGNTLSGEISGPGFLDGHAEGTLSGGSLTVNTFNAYGFNLGQLQLHR